jgi:hypothetical protein
MTTDQLSGKIESLISGFEDAFGKQVNSTQKALFEQMQVLLNKLELSADGLILQNQGNRKILAQFDKYFNKAFNQSGYYATLDKSAGTVSGITTANGEYFADIVDGFTVDAQYIKNLQRETISQFESLLANEGLEAMMKKPLIDILNQNINTGASYSDLLKQVREFAIGNDELAGQLQRYSGQLTTDTLFNFNRAMQEAVSQNSGLDWYLYSGSNDADSREFCKQRAGKYFHRTEIEKWANMDWAGKRRGTTKSSIYVYLGGYRCRHKLIAVSEAVVPKSALNRIKK